MVSDDVTDWLLSADERVASLAIAVFSVGVAIGSGSDVAKETGDVVLVNTLLAQLFRPLDMLGWVYRTIRQGLIDMEAMFALIDTPAEVRDVPGAPELRLSRGRVRFEETFA